MCLFDVAKFIVVVFSREMYLATLYLIENASKIKLYNLSDGHLSFLYSLIPLVLKSVSITADSSECRKTLKDLHLFINYFVECIIGKKIGQLVHRIYGHYEFLKLSDEFKVWRFYTIVLHRLICVTILFSYGVACFH